MCFGNLFSSQKIQKCQSSSSKSNSKKNISNFQSSNISQIKVVPYPSIQTPWVWRHDWTPKIRTLPKRPFFWAVVWKTRDNNQPFIWANYIIPKADFRGDSPTIAPTNLSSTFAQIRELSLLWTVSPLLNPLCWLLEEDLVVEASTCQLQASGSCDQRGGCVSRVLVVDGWSTVDP